MKEKKLIQESFDFLADKLELFTSKDGSAYASVPVDEHFETHPVESEYFARLVRALAYQKTGKLIRDKVLRECIEMLKAQAQVNGAILPVHTRVAAHEGKTYIDLGDPKWSLVEVTADGYQVLAVPPTNLKFIRAQGVLPLPIPEKGGCIDDLRRFVNLRDEQQWYMLVPWLLAALHPMGPYAIMVLNGEAGSAKSTLTTMLRSLIDPNVAPLRALAKSERDLFISAQNSWLTAIDNISYLSDEMADAFCRLSTRGAFVTRKLYTDSREMFFDVCRPALFNGIQEFCFRTDFGDRSLQLTLSRIPDQSRKRLDDVMKEFEAIKPKLFGALLDSLSATIREFPNVDTKLLPRMADFGFFALAVERALGWPNGSFAGAYELMRNRSNEAILESCPFSSVIISLARDGWVGTATALMDEIETKLEDTEWQKRGFPKNPAQLSGQLRRLAPSFRSRGIEVNCDGKTAGTGSRRSISLAMLEPRNEETPPSPQEPKKRRKFDPPLEKALHKLERTVQ
jgi:hypothetical protein